MRLSDMLGDRIGGPSELVATLAEHSSDAVMFVDVDGRVIFWNPVCVSLFGFTPAQAVGAVFPQMAPELRTRAVADLRAIIAAGRVAHRDRQALRSDGVQLLVECVTVPALDSEGHGSGAFVIVHDAVHGTYPQPMTRLVDVVTGGLVAPLDALWAGLGLLSRPEIAADTVRRNEAVAVLRSTLAGARSTAADLAAVVRIASGVPPMERESVDVVSIATELAACETLGVAASVEFAADLGIVIGEQALLVRSLQLLVKLVAGEASDPAEHVRISIDRVADEILIELKSTVSTSAANRVSALDGYFMRGGVPESLAVAEIDAYLVRGIIEAHHGSVGIRTSAASRVRATVRLPAADVTQSTEERP